MTGLEALTVMLVDPYVDSIVMPGNRLSRKRIMVRKEFYQSGIHISAVDLKQDNWKLNYIDMPDNADIIQEI